jgi:protein SCO1/2
VTRRSFWIAIALGVAALIAMAYPITRLYQAHVETREREAMAQSAPTVGGPFTLVNQDGQTVTEADFRGRHMLVFFGYTFCPDVCPTTLQTASSALDLVEDRAAAVQPVFITVDPTRDTPAILKEYVAHFHPSLVGLGGTAEQIAAAAKAYRVYYAKDTAEGDSADDYLVAHSAITYLMDPDGKFVTHFSHQTGAEEMAATLKRHLP